MSDDEAAYNPHRALWQAVLMQAYEDAMNGVPGLKVQRLARIRQTQEARDYLTTPSADLAEVCGNIGLDMDAIIDRMKAKLATARSVEKVVDDPDSRVAGRVIAKRELKQPRPAPFHAIPITIDGVTRTAFEWCAINGVKLGTATNRYHLKSWPLSDGVSIPASEGRARARSTMRQIQDVAYSEAKRRRTNNAQTGHQRGSPPRMLTHNGETRSLDDWSKITGLQKQTIRKRLKSGCTVAEALTVGDYRFNQ